MVKQIQTADAATAAASAARAGLGFRSEPYSGSSPPIAWPSLPARADVHRAESPTAAILEPMLSVEDAALRLHVCEETVRREIRDHRIAAAKVRGQWRISRAALDEYLLATMKPLTLFSRSHSTRNNTS